MSETEIIVQYERKLSDGNYGSEGLALSMSYVWPSEEVTDEYVLDRAEWLRRKVLTFLSRSHASGVARAARYELEAEERWKKAEAAAEYELEAGLRDIANETRGEDFEEPFPP